MFREILRTIPIRVEDAEISFLAGGIFGKTYGKEFDEEVYMRECSERGVMPFSRSELRYDYNSRSFIPQNTSIRSFSEGMLRGGKIHVLEFKTNRFFSYEAFQEKYLEKILEGYHIGRTNLDLVSSDIRRFFFGRSYSDLRFGEGSIEEGTRLGLDGIGSEERVEVVNWFNQLAGRCSVDVYETLIEG